MLPLGCGDLLSWPLGVCRPLPWQGMLAGHSSSTHDLPTTLELPTTHKLPGMHTLCLHELLSMHTLHPHELLSTPTTYTAPHRWSHELPA